MPTKKVPFSVRIPKEVANKFDEKIIDKYQETRTHKSKIVGELLQQYIDQDKLIAQNEETHQKIQKLQQQLQQTQKENQKLQDQLSQLKKEQEDIYQTLTEKEEQITLFNNEKNKWTNKYIHQVEVHQKLLEEHNQLQEEIKKYTYCFGAITNMSWWNRLLGNYPEEMKQLQPPTQEENSNKK